MRTTIDIDDQLYQRAKVVAAASSRTLKQVVEDALRESLARREHGSVKPIDLPVFRGDGLLPGIDLVDISELLEQLEGPFARS